MKVKFDANAPATETSTELAAPAETSREVALPSQNTSSDFQGEISSNDLRLPRLNLVAKTGDLSNEFTPGHFVLSKEVVISDGKTPVEVIAVKISKQYQENLPFGSEGMPKVFNTAAEVREAGGVLGFKKGENIYGEIAHIDLLLPAPEGASEEEQMHFTDEVDGKAYARARYTVASSAYSAVAKPLITAIMVGHLKQTGLPGGKWELTSRIASGNGNSWWAPVIKAAGKNSDATIEQIKALLG